MKELILKYRGVLKFLAVFTLSYVGLYLLYVIFLNFSTTPDYFTKLVSRQSVYVLNKLNYITTAEVNTHFNHIKLYIDNRHVAGITEGCNAISIMILFIAFILSFSKSAKKTLLFGLFGLLFIHFINIIRIVVLIISLHHLPKYSEGLHSFVFPGIIYSTVFLLWMFWVKSFQKTTTKNA
jgi:exosortase family protein XrtF